MSKGIKPSRVLIESRVKLRDEREISYLCISIVVTVYVWVSVSEIDILVEAGDFQESCRVLGA
jgi:hypothetical protein